MKGEFSMAIVNNEIPHLDVGTSYSQSQDYTFAKAFKETADAVYQESTFDLFEEPSRVYRSPVGRETMKKFFMENAIDPNNTLFSIEEKEQQVQEMERQFDNDLQAMREHAVLPEYNPIVGMALPIHKLILMNMVFDKGAIQKVTAPAPKFTISLKRRILVTQSGEEIDMFAQQNLMTAAINNTAPFKEIELALPEMQGTDILGTLGGTSPLDNLAISTHISAIKIPGVVYEVGDKLPNEDGYVTEESEIAESQQTVDTWYACHIEFKPNYGGPEHLDRTLQQPIKLEVKKTNTSGEVEIVLIEDILAASMDKNRFTATSAFGNISDIKIKTRLDTSNAMLPTCSVKWDINTELVEIDTAIPINTTISPEEVKDLAALYQVNQLTEIIGMVKTVLANYKDDTILAFLEDSYRTLPPICKTWNKFDFAPREGYALDHVEWRHKTFFDFLDSEVTHLLQVWNDPNVTVAIFGDPDLIRKITPKEYVYQAPAAIGPVELTYTQTVVNASDKRVYNLLGSDKLRGSDDLIIILNPRGTDRIMYRIYDYQMYVSNEIRNSQNPALPALHSFERFLCKEYQAVQGRVRIENRSGLRPTV